MMLTVNLSLVERNFPAFRHSRETNDAAGGEPKARV